MQVVVRNDGELLAEFSATRNEGAFAELVRRHSRMVLGVCRRALNSGADAEDAAQAVFLVLARKAHTLKTDHSIAPWLHHVACCIARNARSAGNVRRKHEQEAFRMKDPATRREAADSIEQQLDAAITALPARYRQPLLLHHFEGLSHEEASQRMGCSIGTFSSLVSRARDLLRERLSRSDASFSSVALLTLLAASGTAEAPSAAFVASTLKGAVSFASGKAAGGAISLKTATLAQQALHTFFWLKMFKAAGAACILAGIVTFTAAALAPAKPLQTFHVADESGANRPEQILRFAVAQAIDTTHAYVVNERGTAEPFQFLSDNRVAIAAGLKSHESRTWRLVPGTAPKFETPNAVTVIEREHYYEVVNGLTGVRVQKDFFLDRSLAPIQGILLPIGPTHPDGEWTATGPNKLYHAFEDDSFKREVIAANSVDVRCIDSGPLVVSIQVSYKLDRPAYEYPVGTKVHHPPDSFYIPASPGYYTATITIEAGQPSILVEESTNAELQYFLNVHDAIRANAGSWLGKHGGAAEESTGIHTFNYDVPVMPAYFTSDAESGSQGVFKTIARLSPFRKETDDGDWNWLLYNDKAEESAAVIGAFNAQIPNAYSANEVTGAGVYAMPQTRDSAPSIGFCFQSFHRGADNSWAAETRIQWGIFTGRKGTPAGQPPAAREIASQTHLHGGGRSERVSAVQIQTK